MTTTDQNQDWLNKILWYYFQDGCNATDVNNAKGQILAHQQAAIDKAVADRGVAVAQLILNTCKYAGRELFISTGAVKQLRDDLLANSDKHKVLTALKKVEAALTTPK